MSPRRTLAGVAVVAVGGLLGCLVAWSLPASGRPVQDKPTPPAAAQPAAGQPDPEKLDRTILPIAVPKNPPITEIDARTAKPPPFFQVKPPKGAPNVVIVLIDDMGLGQSSAFGGPVHMPTAEKLARNGLKYNRFHTTALCAPTRMALLTGRNHHSCNMGSITETATAFPGQTGVRPQTIAPLAEMLQLNGFSTAMFGKCHEVPPWEISPSGPFDRWPTHSGFDKFYGFMGGETNQYYPSIYDSVARVATQPGPAACFPASWKSDWVRHSTSCT
jgi:arylsulfatase